jgi:hypothetical protein
MENPDRPKSSRRSLGKASRAFAATTLVLYATLCTASTFVFVMIKSLSQLFDALPHATATGPTPGFLLEYSASSFILTLTLWVLLALLAINVLGLVCGLAALLARDTERRPMALGLIGNTLPLLLAGTCVFLLTLLFPGLLD